MNRTLALRLMLIVIAAACAAYLASTFGAGAAAGPIGFVVAVGLLGRLWYQARRK